MVQQIVSNRFLATGIPGEFSRSMNQDAIGKILKSTAEASNVVCRVVFNTAGNDEEVNVDIGGTLAGLLGFPKVTIRKSLDAQAFISNGSQVQVATRGYMCVNLPAAAKIGDFVYYNSTTKALLTAAPATAPAANSVRLPGGLVKGFNITAPGTAEIYFDLSGDTTVTA
jgi:hypothetical protein